MKTDDVKGLPVSTALQTRPAALRVALALCALVGCSASGLVAGSLAHGLTGSSPAAQATNPPAPATMTTVPTASATSGSTTSGSESGGSTSGGTATLVTVAFRLVISADPSVVTAGQQVQVTVAAFAQSSGAPIAGLSCALEAPEDGTTPLLQQWPLAGITDASGRTAWMLPVAGVAPGLYAVGVTASGAHGYRYHAQINITVTRA